MRQWLIKLRGEKSDLEDLPLLVASPDLSIKAEGGEFYLTALELNSLDDDDQVISRGKELLETISAAASFHFQSFTALEISDLIMINENGTRHEHLYLAGATGLRYKWLGTEKDDGSFVPANRSGNVEYLMRLSVKFKEVANALQFFKEDSWVSLYKVYEIIQDDLGGREQLIQTKWTTRGILNKIKQTAQSELALGPEARHASKKYRAPKVPMSKFEAHYFIRELLLCWIRTKSL